MFKKILYISLCIAVFVGLNTNSIKNYGKKPLVFSDLTDTFAWAKPAVDELSAIGAISGISDGIFAPTLNVSKEQFAKMLTICLSVPATESSAQTFIDVPADRWSYKYIEATSKYFPANSDYPINEFKPELLCTRELFAVTVAKALGLEPIDSAYLDENFKDADVSSPDWKGLLSAAAKANILSGSDGFLYPQNNVTRAEAAVILKRAADYRSGKKTDTETKKTEKTSILGKSQIPLEQAIRWAKSKNADERFIDVAPTYWEYGEKTGIRPEVLYAQAAKETNYGKYTGNVIPSQNNWAGIKTVAASGDATYDHETFNSAEDGVRGHFNHMCAYVGVAPIGEPHARFNSVKTAAWAGTIKYVEELGGKWAPDESYGKSIVENYMHSMANS